MPVALDSEFRFQHPDASGFIELFEFLPGVVFYAKDLTGRYVAANSAMAQSKNKTSPEEILGQFDSHFHPPLLAEAYLKEDSEIIKSGEALPNQTWFVIERNGKPGWHRSSKTPIRSSPGELIGIAGVRYPISTPEDIAGQFQNLTAAVRHIEENYTDTITAEQLADLAGLSVTHFNRRFSEVFRMSPNRFLISVRIEKAQYLLTSTTNSLAEVAAETGFYDQSHFTRHFRKITGLTPRKYRELFRS